MENKYNKNEKSGNRNLLIILPLFSKMAAAIFVPPKSIPITCIINPIFWDRVSVLKLGKYNNNYRLNEASM